MENIPRFTTFFILFLFYVYILFSSYRVWIILFVLFVEFFLVSFSCIWDIPSHGFSLWLLLVSVMIHSDAKRRLSVPSSLNGSGRLPGNQKVHRSSPREVIFFFVLSHIISDTGSSTSSTYES